MEEPDPGAGRALAALTALAFAGIGLGALAAPRSSSRGYGLPADDVTSLAYVRALGARDLVLGLVLLSLRRERRHFARSVGLCALVAAADLLIVANGRGLGAGKSLLIHTLGAAWLTWSTGLF
jgi:hypothetical protein